MRFERLALLALWVTLGFSTAELRAQIVSTGYSVLVRDIAEAPPDASASSGVEPLALVGERTLFHSRAGFALSNPRSLFSLHPASSAPTLLTDVLTEPSDGSLDGRSGCLDADRWIFWTYESATLRSSLWRTDGTNEGTQLVARLPPGAAGGLRGYRERLTSCDEERFGEQILFMKFAVDSLTEARLELWSTDGSQAGTSRVTELGPLWGSNAVSGSERLGSILLFAAATDPEGFRLWRTDGTAAGTYPIVSALPGVDLLAGDGFVRVGERAFFVGSTSGEATPLIFSDGTGAGTATIPDLLVRTEVADSDVGYGIAALEHHVVLPATLGPEFELFSVDAATLDVVQLTEFDEVYDIQRMSPANAGSRATFLFELPGATIHQVRNVLVGTDGTIEGTRILPLPCSASAQCTASFAAHAGAWDLVMSRGVNDTQLLSTGGTPQTTQTIAAFPEGTACGVYPIGEVAGKAYFRTCGVDTELALWVSDGTAGGTFPILTDLEADFSDSHFLGGAPLASGGLLFSASTPGSGNEPWITDGTAAGTRPLADLASFVPSGQPERFSAREGDLLFVAATPELGAELWFTDGTSTGSSLVSDHAPGNASSQATVLPSVDGRWGFLHRSDGSDDFYRLGFTDGAPGPLDLTELEATPGAEARRVGDGAVLSDGRNLWRYGGNPPALTHLALVGQEEVSRSRFLAGDERRVFLRNDHVSSSGELWVTDGTIVGTGPFCDVPGFPTWELDENLSSLGEGVVLTARTGEYGAEPWACAAQGEPALRLADIRDGVADSSPAGYRELGSLVLFAATDSAGDRELWRTDGTVEGTFRLADLCPEGSSDPRELTRLGSWIIFSAEDEAHGREPWVTDGSVAGTRLLKDLAPGPYSSRPGDFEVVGGAVVFAAQTLAHGRELWITDGRSESTRLLEDVQPGPASSRPEELTVAGDRLYYRATDHRGSELWSLCASWIAPASFAHDPIYATPGFDVYAWVATHDASPLCGPTRLFIETRPGTALPGEHYVPVVIPLDIYSVGQVRWVSIPTFDTAPEDANLTFELVLRDALGRERDVATVVLNGWDTDDDPDTDEDGDPETGGDPTEIPVNDTRGLVALALLLAAWATRRISRRRGN